MNSGLPDRKIMRLKGYDYNRQGVIFLTVCTLDRKCILSQIRMQEDQNVPSVLLSEYGRIAEKYLIQIGSFYDFIKIDEENNGKFCYKSLETVCNLAKNKKIKGISTF